MLLDGQVRLLVQKEQKHLTNENNDRETFVNVKYVRRFSAVQKLRLCSQGESSNTALSLSSNVVPSIQKYAIHYEFVKTVSYAFSSHIDFKKTIFFNRFSNIFLSCCKFKPNMCKTTFSPFFKT